MQKNIRNKKRKTTKKKKENTSNNNDEIKIPSHTPFSLT